MPSITVKTSYGLICCACKREQRIVAPDEAGGTTISEARYIGWVAVYTDEGAHWLCPFCADGKQSGLSRREQRFWRRLYEAYFKYNLSPHGARGEDLPMFAQGFADEGVRRYRKSVAGVTEDGDGGD